MTGNPLGSHGDAGVVGAQTLAFTPSALATGCPMAKVRACLVIAGRNRTGLRVSASLTSQGGDEGRTTPRASSVGACSLHAAAIMFISAESYAAPRSVAPRLVGACPVNK